MIAPKFMRTAALPQFHGRRTILRPVTADKLIPQTVKPVRFRSGSKILAAELLIKQIILDHPVLIRRTGTIKAHLKILVIDGNMVKGKFTISKQAQIPGLRILIFHHYIPKFRLIAQWH